jgi:glyoxylase-like metal-dependent hydrolase (beta-lactamase superfamily II)
MNALTTLIVTLYGLAGTPQQPPKFDLEIKTSRLSDQLYLLDGGGGNVLAFVWDDGVLIVDDKIAPVSAELKAAIAAITPKPIRFVVNTHWHPDHRGGNAALAADGAVVVAQENVRRRMSVDGFVGVFGRKQPASPPAALPVVTFTRDVTFHLGGEEISVVHVDAAHTDGDVFVRFRKANALHLGDCYLNGSYPVIDYTNGGTYAGTIAAADIALGMSNAETRIIPGHGAISNAGELRTWRDMLAAVFDRVKVLARAGKSLDQVKRERPTAEWDDRLPATFVTSDHVIEEAYREATDGLSR